MIQTSSNHFDKVSRRSNGSERILNKELKKRHNKKCANRRCIQSQQTDTQKNQMKKMNISQTDIPFSSSPLDCQCYRQEQHVIPHRFCRHLPTPCRFTQVEWMKGMKTCCRWWHRSSTSRCLCLSFAAVFGCLLMQRKGWLLQRVYGEIQRC